MAQTFGQDEHLSITTAQVFRLARVLIDLSTRLNGEVAQYNLGVLAMAVEVTGYDLETCQKYILGKD